MKAHFIEMFDYDQYANLLILQSILEQDTPKKTVQLMAHLLAAQQVWLNRCKGLSASVSTLWPDWKAGTFESCIQKNYSEWVDFINQQKPEDFNKIISYQNSKGESFQNSVSEILAHVINHGTHHRAQIGQHLKFGGLKQLPATDYIVYLRNKDL